MSEVKMEKFKYDEDLPKLFVYATIIWGFIALALGVTVAFQLASWKVNLGMEWTTFGRLRPLHTNAAIFAFVGNAMFAGIYYSTQRLVKARLFSDFLGRVHFWGWQLIIVAAAISLPLGLSQAKEYAELEWPIDIAIAVVWIIFAINFFGTLARRREKHIYVSIWFYIATIITVALLHVVNAISLPVDLMKSYPVYAGVQDALVQWWYGHNAVAFFLTTPFLGLMYYFIPKAANRPVYSYRLSIIHFWSLVFIYIWAGPHHLLNTAVPDWVQTTGMVFSIMLWMPSWGGMINGLLTLRGAWDKVRTDPVLKFLATSVTFYGMATFEGPLLAIKSVSAMAHYTDWIVGHVHSGTIGWNYMMIAGILYYLVPKMYNTKLYSVKLANTQFWLATIGLLLYMMAMWTAGITQSLMWSAIDETGKLVYPNFIETVVRIVPMYWVRGIGGVLVLVGFILMIYNLWKTAKSSDGVQEHEYMAPAIDHSHTEPGESGHRKLEGLTTLFSILTFLAVLVGGVVEIVPSLISDKFVEKDANIKPYSPLEIVGRDIFIKEGCYTCHSQHVRPMADEILRYGAASRASESVYDRPFQWGSRRIGPDIARVGGKYNDMWHYRHMLDPREVTPKSIMPVYPWLFKKKYDLKSLPKKLRVMQSLGVPYSDEEIASSIDSASKQAFEITKGLSADGVDMNMQSKEIIPLIAYLQRLGVDGAKSLKMQEEAKAKEENQND
ncbi:putative cytochrome C oxidase subunit [Halobacteriovorax marinus SJ]|uniref:cytochrome-c oxidase n=1 Tax=Halobacteriovorax marinus (strain ATCC BAA-682 / DSM 15412 / SJ) TaxID=862908 RepID=E1WZS8_HALMS|nr:cytochrome-c oxidase, cbb3-type subunit I [Halobacteriovorax marinus]CBW26264.1 putative cytochrome C oxidase subunit [Halobacteriovorax marinus SJ]